MRVIRCPERRLRQSLCLALGVFDGVHLGHQEVIRQAVGLADGTDCKAAVLTFDPHPSTILNRHGAPPLLTTSGEKAALLRDLGVDLVLVACFDEEMAEMPAEDFVEDVLVGRLRVRCIIVGENWRFGRGARGTPEMLRKLADHLGFSVTVVPAVVMKQAKVSSTRIRRLLQRGQVRRAADLLGRHYSLQGKVVSGDGLGRSLGFPTANLELPPHKLVPADGVYASLSGKRRLWPAVTYIGWRPTFGGDVRRVEVHLLKHRGPVDLNGRTVRTELVDRLRGDKHFEDRDDLIAQMERDCHRARRILTSADASV